MCVFETGEQRRRRRRLNVRQFQQADGAAGQDPEESILAHGSAIPAGSAVQSELGRVRVWVRILLGVREREQLREGKVGGPAGTGCQ